MTYLQGLNFKTELIDLKFSFFTHLDEKISKLEML